MTFGIIRYAAFGLLVKRSRRRPLTAETGVRFPHKLRSGADSGESASFISSEAFGDAVREFEEDCLSFLFKSRVIGEWYEKGIKKTGCGIACCLHADGMQGEDDACSV